MDKFIFVDKGYLIGLPARDIDADEWKEFPKELTKAALEQGLYKPKKEAKKEVENA